MTIDRTVSVTPLPGYPGLSLAVYYIRSPYHEAEETAQTGPMAGYYTQVLDHRREPLSAFDGPYQSLTAAEQAGRARATSAVPLTYTTVLSAGNDAVWDHLDRYEQADALPFEPTRRTARYLLLRDLVAAMEDAGDDIAGAVADALDEVARLKGVSTGRETPPAPANPLTDKDLPF